MKIGAPSGAIVASPQLKRLRAMQMLECRVKGMTLTDIAEQFSCSDDTVARTLEWAAREGLIQDAEEKILQGLVPKAIKVYEAALENNDTFVAKDVLTHLMKISDRVAQRKEHVEELSLAAYLKTRKTIADDKAADAGDRQIGPSDITVEAVPLLESEGPESLSPDLDERRVPAAETGPAGGEDADGTR